MSDSNPAISVETVGANPVRMWSLDTGTRVRRMAALAGLGGTGAPVVLANAGYVFHSAWLASVAAQPGSVITLEGAPVLAHARDEGEAAALRRAMRGEGPLPQGIIETQLDNVSDEVGFMLPLIAQTRRDAEWASWNAARAEMGQPGGFQLWPRASLLLARAACALRMGRGTVRLLGIAPGVLAVALFAGGAILPGLLAVLAFALTEPVGRTLARCAPADAPA